LLNHHADTLGFDAISAGGILAWLMDCLSDGLIRPEMLGIEGIPVFKANGFRIVEDSMHNAKIGVALLDQMIGDERMIDLAHGARKFGRQLARKFDKEILDRFVYNAFARQGWIVPNQYWSPGVLSPMAIMGKYYMNYGKEFIPPRELGNENARRLVKELMLDNTGICRFHRAWAEDLMPDIIDALFGHKAEFLRTLKLTASRINSRNSSVFWESSRSIDFIQTFLNKKHTEDGVDDPELLQWIKRFEADKTAAALDFWYEIHKGIHETLREF
jgi:glyceraldehyde-3-phosphate dehydrogenase (ferredoxin)